MMSADISEIMQSGLHEYIDNFQMKLNKVGDAIASSFFTMQHPEILIERKKIR